MISIEEGKDSSNGRSVNILELGAEIRFPVPLYVMSDFKYGLRVYKDLLIASLLSA